MVSSQKFSFSERAVLPGIKGKHMFVSGSTKGIGREIAFFLAECGAHVSINGRDESECHSVAAEIHDRYDVKTLACPGDVSILRNVQSLFKEIEEWCGGILDAIICNAGFPLRDDLWSRPVDQLDELEITSGFQDVYKVDVLGARYCTWASLKLMKSQRSGALVYISSTPALTGYKGTAYTEAKSAILGLMRDVAVEYAPFQVRANALALGNIKSGWYFALGEDERERLSKEAPLERWGEARDVAGATAFLVSDLANFITGQTLVVDGGKVIR